MCPKHIFVQKARKRSLCARCTFIKCTEILQHAFFTGRSVGNTDRPAESYYVDIVDDPVILRELIHKIKLYLHGIRFVRQAEQP